VNKYLLDTHTLIWLIESSPKISDDVKKKIKLPETMVYLSSVSLWEIAIKISIGKLELKSSFSELLSDLHKTDIIILQIENSYLRTLINLPFIHKDPFDRLIIGTALVEGLTVITADEDIRKYNIPWIW